MSTNNTITLDTYQTYFANYVDGTAPVTTGFQKEWIDFLLSHIEYTTPILEIGSATGRDATYISQQGYANILTTDAFEAAVNMLKSKGLAAERFNILTDSMTGMYGLIIASAVFLHFTDEEFRFALGVVKAHLSKDGILGFSVKQGEGAEWSEHKMGAPRFFNFWSEPELRETLEYCGYAIIDLRSTDDNKWIHVTCKMSK